MNRFFSRIIRFFTRDRARIASEQSIIRLQEVLRTAPNLSQINIFERFLARNNISIAHLSQYILPIARPLLIERIPSLLLRKIPAIPAANYEDRCRQALVNMARINFNATQIARSASANNSSGASNINRPFLEENQLFLLCEELYSNSDKQIAEFIASLCKSSVLKLDISTIEKFFTLLKSDSIAIKLTQLLYQDHRIQLSAKNIIYLTKGRLSEQYQSLKGFLSQPFSAEFFSETGFEEVEKKMRMRFDDTRELTMHDIFLYYQITKEISEFVKCLNNDSLQAIRQDFKIIDNAFISHDDYKNFELLVGKELNFPSFANICDYLEDKTATRKFNHNAAAYKINFTGSKFSNSAEMELEGRKINKTFQELLSVKNPPREKILNFFTNAFAVEFPEEKHQNGLCKFFNGHKNEMAQILLTDGGFEKFQAGVLQAFNDGCPANVATQLRIVASDCAIQKPADKILYSYFYQKIVVPTINDDNYIDIIGESSDIFKILRRESQYINPLKLLQDLTYEFHDKNGDLVRGECDFLKNYMDEEIAQKLLYASLNKFPKDFKDLEREVNKKFAQIAAFFVLDRTMPTILDHELLREITRENEELINSVAAQPRHVAEQTFVQGAPRTSPNDVRIDIISLPPSQETEI